MRLRRMRMKRPSAGLGGGGVNATPLIDVVMCLIVFYLIVGKLASGQLAEVDLPPSSIGESDTGPELFVVNVVPATDELPAWRGGGSGATAVLVEGESIPSPDALGAMLTDRIGRKPHTEVQVRASRTLRFGDVAPVLDVCATSGAPNVRLVTHDARMGR